MITAEDTDRAVTEVARHFDEVKPGWADVLVHDYGVNLEWLFVSDPYRCVLSSLYGDYSDGWRALRTDYGFEDTPGVYTTSDGIKIDAAIACLQEDNEKLRVSWLREVTSRSTLV